MKSKLTRILLGGALTALLACQAAAQGKISGITTKAVGEGLEVQIQGEKLGTPKITRLQGGRSFLLEFDASLTSDPQWLRVEQGGVHYVQSVWSQSNPPKIRIHLRVDPSTKLDVNSSTTGFVVKATPGPHSSKSAPKTAPETIKIYHESAKLTAADTTQHVPVAPVVANVPLGGRLVSLDFVNTEIVQILKALAMEAGVNIVTSPDVKGSLTVSLGSVSIKQALDLVTTMSGLKYAEVGGTYIVTSSKNLGYVMNSLSGTKMEVSTTRVVPIYSGEGPHIKDALRTTSVDVEILLPSEKPLTPQALAAATSDINGGSLEGDKGKGAANQAQQQAPQQTNNDSKNPAKDAYLVLVGPVSRVDDIEREVKDVDEQICKSLGVDYPLANVMSRQVYHPQGNTAMALLQAIAPSTDKSSGGGFHAKVGTVEIFATPTGSSSAQAVVLYGRESEVNRLMENLQSIDQLSSSQGDFVIYGVKYLDPRALREDLVAKFPGLTVNVAPSAVANPAVYMTGKTLSENQQKTADNLGANQNGAAQSGNTISGSSTSTATSTATSDDGSKIGITNPFAGTEMDAVPMKLVLRGGKEMLQNAMNYLNAIDVEPKQVALELRVMELTKEDAINLGLDWSILTGGSVSPLHINEGLNSADSVGTATGNFGWKGGGNLSVTATLDQLAGTNKMIARPNVLAVDGRESEMFVGDDIKYIQSIQSTAYGTTVTTADVQVGVKLAVLPRIGANDSISMDLRPMVSTLESFTPVPGGGEIPQTGLRIAQSTMVMRTGETIAIGGLIQDTDTKQTSGIPILKDLPIIGMLFRRTNNDHKRTEVVFFLTAKVVDHSNIENAASPYRNGQVPLGPVGNLVGNGKASGQH